LLVILSYMCFTLAAIDAVLISLLFILYDVQITIPAEDSLFEIDVMARDSEDQQLAFLLWLFIALVVFSCFAIISPK
jgi:hypothetical protein